MMRKLSTIAGLALFVFALNASAAVRTEFSRKPNSEELVFATEPEMLAQVKQLGLTKEHFKYDAYGEYSNLVEVASKQIRSMHQFFGKGFFSPPSITIDITNDANEGWFYPDQDLIMVGPYTSLHKRSEPLTLLNFAVVLAHEYGHAVFAHYMTKTLKKPLSAVANLPAANEFFADLYAAFYLNNLSVIGTYVMEGAKATGTPYCARDFNSQVPDHIEWNDFQEHGSTEPARGVFGYWLKYRLNEKATPQAVLKAVLDASALLLQYGSNPFEVIASKDGVKSANWIFVDAIIAQLVNEGLLSNKSIDLK